MNHIKFHSRSCGRFFDKLGQINCLSALTGVVVLRKCDSEAAGSSMRYLTRSALLIQSKALPRHFQRSTLLDT